MTRRLALELAGGDARAIVASASESRITVERSLVAALATEEEQPDATAVANAVADSLLAAGVTRLETIAIVGRADVELRLLTVPPVPDAELPNLVRFQAARELPNLDASLPLDYLPLGEGTDEPRRVLAAVLKPGVKQRLDAVCEAAKLTLTHVVLRSAASASLVLRRRPEVREGCCLLVEILGRQVELAAVNEGRVVFLRHMLLAADPTESPEAADALFPEIRRTLAVAASQENVATVAPIVLVGESPPRRALAEKMSAAVDGPVVLVEPMAGVGVAGAATGLAPADRDRAAAMLGALADEAASRPHAFDFLNPRQPPKPPSRRNTYALAGAIAIALLLVAVVVNVVRTNQLKAEVREKQTRSAELEPKVRDAEGAIAASGQVDKWLATDAVWLEELRWLSEKFPKAQDARLTKLVATSDDRRGELSLSGLARDSRVFAGLDRGLRDESHQVVGKKSEERRDGPYSIKFDSSVQIKRPK